MDKPVCRFSSLPAIRTQFASDSLRGGFNT
jgi:hypothetical protein